MLQFHVSTHLLGDRININLQCREGVGRLLCSNLNRILLDLHILNHLSIQYADHHIRSRANRNRNDRMTSFRLKAISKLLRIKRYRHDRTTILHSVCCNSSLFWLAVHQYLNFRY
ncbi:hypothetical protein D3C77_332200 [compost metagenome]